MLRRISKPRLDQLEVFGTGKVVSKFTLEGGVDYR